MLERQSRGYGVMMCVEALGLLGYMTVMLHLYGCRRRKCIDRRGIGDS